MATATMLPEETSLQLYLKEIARSRPLSHKDEIALSERIRDGDRRAMNQMVLANLRFVVSVARNYEHQGLPLGDLINEGNLGLIKAAKRFDGRKNFKFISYAVWWVRQAILQALADQSRIVKLPVNRVGTMYRIGKALKRLEQRYFRKPDIHEVARETNLKERDVRESMRIGDKYVSLDAPVDRDDDARVMDAFHDETVERPDEFLVQMSLQEEIRRTLEQLDEREKRVMRLYFGLDEEVPHTLDDIGRRMRLTRERTRQIKENAIRRIRGAKGAMRLRSYT